MSPRVESDDWRPGPNILAPDNLARLRELLDEAPLIVECRFYRGSRAPERRIFEGFEELEAYLRAAVRPGDDVWIWRHDRACRDDNPALHAKAADTDGCVPLGGVY